MLKVSGASDDLIEVEGDIREEFNTDDGYVVTDTGVVLHVAFTQGGWRIRQVDNTSIDVDITSGTGPEEEDDEAVIHEDISWVMWGLQMVKKGK